MKNAIHGQSKLDAVFHLDKRLMLDMRFKPMLNVGAGMCQLNSTHVRIGKNRCHPSTIYQASPPRSAVDMSGLKIF